MKRLVLSSLGFLVGFLLWWVGGACGRSDAQAFAGLAGVLILVATVCASTYLTVLDRMEDQGCAIVTAVLGGATVAGWFLTLLVGRLFSCTPWWS